MEVNVQRVQNPNNYNAEKFESSIKYKNITNMKQPKAPQEVKRGVLLTTALGVAAGVALAMKRGKFLKNATKKNLMTVDYDWKNVLMIASGSIIGGVAGGTIFDKKENLKAKLREGLIQFLGNVLVPIGCVGGGTAFFKKHFNDDAVKCLKLPPKLKGLPNVIVTALSLATAIFAGFKTGNFINENIYHIRDDRKFKFADMAGHLDDTCMALSLGAPNNPVTNVASRIIPLALLVCGYSSGVMQEWPDDVISSRVVAHKSHHKVNNEMHQKSHNKTAI